MTDTIRRSTCMKQSAKVGASIAIIGMAALFAVSGCGSASETEASSETKVSSKKSSVSSEPPAGEFQAMNVYTFGSLDQMVATADLTVRGTVADVYQGEPDAEGTPEEVQYLDAVVSVDEDLKESVRADTVTVSTPELAYAPPHVEWRKPGERVVLFLSDVPELPGIHIPVNFDQSVYVLQGSDIVATVRDSEQPLAENVARLSMPELRREVDQAKARIEKGKVKPCGPCTKSPTCRRRGQA